MKRYIRSATMSNKELAQKSKDPEVLAQLADDESRQVRSHIAFNPNTPVDALVQLVNDEDEGVRASLASNPNTPANALVQLANDESGWVRCNVAFNKNTPADVLIQLANDEKDTVRYWATRNPNTPADAVSNQQSTQNGSQLITEQFAQYLYETLDAAEDDIDVVVHNNWGELMTPDDFADQLYSAALGSGVSEDELDYNYILNDVTNAFDEYVS